MMTQYRLVMAALLAAFALTACGKQEAEMTAAEPAPAATAEPAAPAADAAMPSKEETAPAAPAQEPAQQK